MYKLNNTVEKMVLGEKIYLGNFSSGALVPLDFTREKIVEIGIFKNEFEEDDFKADRGFFEELKNGGYFTTVEQPLASAYLHVTNICNLNCIGCYSYDRTRNCADKLSLDNIKYIINQLMENGVESITISGGEPTIRKDIVEIVRYAKSMGLQTLNLITNGTLYDEEKLKQLKPYVDTLAVSIDGYSYANPRFIRDEGTFPKVVKFIEGAKEIGLSVCILPTLHRHNIEHIEEYMKLSHQLKVPISYSLLTCSSELEDFIPTEENLNYLANYFIRFMKKGIVPLQDYTNLEAKKNCGAGSSIISVTSEGDVYPCHMMHDTDTKMGNILEIPLNEILRNAVKLPTVDDIEKCRGCNIKNVCGGGCKARALLINGSWEQPDPYCEMNLNYYTQFLEEYMDYA